MAHLFFGNHHPFNMGPPDLKFTPRRGFHLMGASIMATAVAPNKTFTNPNFVNNLTKYQTHTVKSQSDTSGTKNYKNSSLINSIKEHCPEIIENPNFCMTKATENSMGIGKTQNINIKKERGYKKKQLRKQSKHNQNRQLLKEIMDFENFESSQTLFELENSLPKPNKFDLNKILIDTPLKKLVSTIPIPLARNKDMIVTLISQSPPFRPSQISNSDSDNQNNDRMLKNEYTSPSRNGHKVYLFDKEGRLTDSLTSEKSYKENDQKLEDSQICQINTDKNDNNSTNRSKFPSICDSEDSLIVFEDETCQHQNENTYKNYRSARKLTNRHRIPSVCESEDSFIVFDEGKDTESTDSDYDLTDSDYDLTDFEGESEIQSEHECQSEEESSFDVVEPRKVRFQTPEKLCEVHPMIKWSYAYQAARKGEWEELARDRVRFKDRIKNTEEKIKKVFEKEHRGKIYKTRFDDMKESREECM